MPKGVSTGRFYCVASRGRVGWNSMVPPQFGGTITARTLEGLKQQAEAIATQLGQKLRFEPALPLKVLKKVDAARAARRQAKEQQERARALTKEAITELAREGLAVRDIAVFTGMTFQRVHQLLVAAKELVG